MVTRGSADGDMWGIPGIDGNRPLKISENWGFCLIAR